MPAHDRYPVPAARFRCETEVQGSRFVTTVAPVATLDEARKFVAGVKAEFPAASHNCWAFLVGPPGSLDRVGLSDDGEPPGTAGRPMLTALQHGGVGDAGVVVTRYFGGRKLGRGGLVKAYTAAVLAALESLPRQPKTDWFSLQAVVDYAHTHSLEQRFADFEVEIEGTEYAEQVCYRLRLPTGRVEAFCRMVADLTAGRGLLA